jgi:maltose O-acetyltransferase
MYEEISLLKIFYWDIKNAQGRFQFLHCFIRNIPGGIGIRLRRKWLGKYFLSCGKNLIIATGFKIRNPQLLAVGDNVNISDDVFIQAGGEVEIGNNVAIGPSAKIWSQNHKVEGLGAVNEVDYEYKKVVIEDDVWLGANCFIMPGVTIKKGSIISACSVVGVKAYPQYAIIAGNPARVIGNRQAMSGNSADTQSEASA